MNTIRFPSQVTSFLWRKINIGTQMSTSKIRIYTSNDILQILSILHQPSGELYNFKEFSNALI